MIVAPEGYAQVVAMFGDPMPYTRDDGTPSMLWESHMTSVPLPAPLPLGWNKTKLALTARVNRLLVEECERVFGILKKEGLWRHLRTFDGGYTWRPQRGSSSKLSMHSFGIALDFDSETNRQGTPGDINPGIVQVFEACGWTWGGRFKDSRIDPMHFQFAKGV